MSHATHPLGPNITHTVLPLSEIASAGDRCNGRRKAARSTFRDLQLIL
jgi:hypothetical protein